MAENKGYGQFCPVALAAEVLAERWTPLIIRELLMGSTRFNDLQRGLPRMSSSLLAQRLRQLQFAGVLDRRHGEGGGFEYQLTPSGRELFPIIEGMGLWAQRWLRHELADLTNLDPDLLMWDIRRNVLKHVQVERQRHVAAFQLVGAPINRRRYWLVFERGSVDLCYKDPGFDVDLFIEADLRTLTEIWLGHVTIDDAVRKHLLRFEGARRNVAAFRSWFTLSMFAPAGRFPTGQQELTAK
jgi:DNA-binding HxlR family transcriptional regulator